MATVHSHESEERIIDAAKAANEAMHAVPGITRSEVASACFRICRAAVGVMLEEQRRNIFRREQVRGWLLEHILQLFRLAGGRVN